MGPKLLKIWFLIFFICWSNPNSGQAQVTSDVTRYYYINFVFEDGWSTDSMIYKIIQFNEKYPPVDGFMGDRNIYETEKINPIDVLRAPLDSIKIGILNMFYVHNQFYSMQDRTQVKSVLNEFFFKNSEFFRKKYKFREFKICGYPLVDELRDLDKNRLEYHDKWVLMRFNRLKIRVRRAFYEKNKHLYFDALLGIMYFDENRIKVYPKN